MLGPEGAQMCNYYRILYYSNSMCVLSLQLVQYVSTDEIVLVNSSSPRVQLADEDHWLLIISKEVAL